MRDEKSLKKDAEMKENIPSVLEERRKEIETILKKYLPREEGYQKTVIEAMNYSILAGGKRLRPMLLLETYRLFCKKPEYVTEPFMAAVEWIHTYSLVHDDLPAMDNDAYRRGKKTTHMVYGEAMGILAGDGLLNYAFEIISDSFCQNDTKLLTNQIKAFQILAKKSGIYGMIGGQTVDIELTNHSIELEKIKFIYELKTCALIEGAMMAGAALAGASDEEIKKIERIAYDIGMAFQIQDDILDVIGCAKLLGKPIHSDEKNQKETYVVARGLEEAKKDTESLTEHALNQLDLFPYDNPALRQLILTLVHREK